MKRAQPRNDATQQGKMMVGGAVEKKEPVAVGLAQKTAVKPIVNASVAPSRRGVVLARWRDLSVAAFSAACIVLLTFALFRNQLVAITAVPAWELIAALLVAAAGYLRVPRRRRAAFLGLKHFGTYPPLWVAGLGGASSVLLVLGLAPSVRESLSLAAAYSVGLILVGLAPIAAGALLLVARIASKLLARTAIPEADCLAIGSAISDEPALDGSFERVTTWLATDQPIDQEEEDRFDHRRVAQRIAGRLAVQSPPAQAVIGKLGAGKTGLRKLVVHALARLGRQDVHVVPVELWPYETSRAAVEGVVRALVEALSNEVNVVALRGLPESYVQAMSSAGGMWSTVAHLQGAPKSPFAALKQIDTIASAIGHTYVVWVEDLERFAGRGGDTGRETVDEAERLNPIRALLYGLDQLQSVSVITATTSLRVRFDLEKIARFVEELPNLPERKVAKVIATFRKGCRERFDVIDPAAPAVRKELDDLLNIERLEIRRAIVGDAVRTLGDALPVLCPTPRSLKHALRSVLDTWKRLAGEIDIDDLLAMSILRADQPDVFALVNKHLDALRGRGLMGAEDQQKALEGWKTEFQAQKIDIRTRRAIEAIIKFVFGNQNGEGKPQGLAQTGYVDYWQRFVSVPVLAEAEQDQKALRVAVAGSDDELVRQLEDSSRSDAMERFARLLSTDQLRRLLVPLVRRRSTEDPSRWPDSEIPGLIPLWRMWSRRAELGELKPSVVLEGIREALDVAVPQSLFVAAKLEQFFVNPSHEVRRMLGDDLVNAARQHLRDLVVATYAESPEALADALKGAPHATLLWACWGIDRVRAGTMTGEPFRAWPTLAATILEAARLRPLELIPQVACLVSRGATVSVHRGEFAQGYTFDAGAAMNLFGSVEKVLDLFATQEASRWAGVTPVEAVLTAVGARHSPSSGRSP